MAKIGLWQFFFCSVGILLSAIDWKICVSEENDYAHAYI